MTDAPRFVINGTEFPVPTRASLTLDEHIVFHEWTHTHLEEIDDTPINALMIGAFMQIAFQRANPELPQATARRIVGQANFEGAMATLVASEQEEDARPPELPKSEHEPSGSPTRNASSQSTSGDGSTTRSDTPANGQTSGGPQPLDMSVTSGQLRSVG